MGEHSSFRYAGALPGWYIGVGAQSTLGGQTFLPEKYV